MDAPVASPTNTTKIPPASLTTNSAMQHHQQQQQQHQQQLQPQRLSHPNGSIPAPMQSDTAKVGASSTESLLKEFSLVAEAAKRAQVAVMVRDLENCGLS